MDFLTRYQIHSLFSLSFMGLQVLKESHPTFCESAAEVRQLFDRDRYNIYDQIEKSV